MPLHALLVGPFCRIPFSVSQRAGYAMKIDFILISAGCTNPFPYTKKSFNYHPVEFLSSTFKIKIHLATLVQAKGI